MRESPTRKPSSGGTVGDYPDPCAGFKLPAAARCGRAPCVRAVTERRRSFRRDGLGHTPAVGKRIGILTGGGDCPGLNAVIRAATLTARGVYGWDVVGIRNGFEGLYEEEYMELTEHGVQGLLARGGTILGSSNRANPFAYPLKLPDGRVEIHDVSARCLANLNRLDLEGLIVVGGDGTMSFSQKFLAK